MKKVRYVSDIAAEVCSERTDDVPAGLHRSVIPQRDGVEKTLMWAVGGVLTCLALFLVVAAVGCRTTSLCDYDQDGLCPPVDCDDRDAAIGECPDEESDDDTELDETAPPSPTPLETSTPPPPSRTGSPTPPSPSPVVTGTPLPSVACFDGDGDGFGVYDDPAGRDDTPAPEADCSIEDCDDVDPEVHPGAVEVCDERDNDCDGKVIACWGSARWSVWDFLWN